MDNPGSCNTDSFLGNHPNKILIMKPKSNSTHICTKCQRPREVGGGCYTFCNGKNFLPIPEEKPQTPEVRNHEYDRYRTRRQNPKVYSR